MKKSIYILAAVAVAMSACQKDIADNDAIRSDSLTPISLPVSIGQQTKAPVYNAVNGTGQFSAGDILGLYVIRTAAGHENELIDNDYVQPNQETSSSNDFYWEYLGYRNLRFSAYYPRVESMASHTAYIFDAAAATGDDADALWANKDLLVAASDPVVFPASVAPLTFNHAMCKLEVCVFNGYMKTADKMEQSFEYDDLLNATITVMAKEKAKVNLLNATSEEYIDDGYAAGQLTPVYNKLFMYTDSDSPYIDCTSRTLSYIVAPQEISGTDNFVEITIGDYNTKFEYKPGTDLHDAFQSGKVVRVTIYLGINTIHVGTDTDYDIEAWAPSANLDKTPGATMED